MTARIWQTTTGIIQPAVAIFKIQTVHHKVVAADICSRIGRQATLPNNERVAARHYMAPNISHRAPSSQAARRPRLMVGYFFQWPLEL